MKERTGPSGPARGALAGNNYEPALGLSPAVGVWLADDFAWAGTESTGGGGAVDSVNGQTGVVVLDADDVGALEAADIGVSVQGYDALLQAIAALSMVADRYIYGTGTDTVALGTITSFARSILDDVDAAAVRATIGAGTGNGDVVGPSSADDNHLARFDATTGKLLQNSSVHLTDGGVLRPATTDAQQLGNKDYVWLEAWIRQVTGTTQSAAQAPSGGWTSSQWALWSNASGVPKHTYNGTTADVARVVDQVSDPFAGYGDSTDPGWGRFWVSAAASTSAPLTGAALGLWGQSASTGAPSYSITYNSTTGYYLGWNCSTTTPRGPYAGSSTGAGTYDSLRKSRSIAVFAGGTVSTTRMFFGFGAWGVPEAITAATTDTRACVRFGFVGTAIHAICADGTTRSIATFSRTISDGEALAFEIVPGTSSVTFNLYSFTPFSKTGRYSFIESATISANLPSGSTPANWLIAAQSTSGTPQARLWGVCAASVLA